MDINDVNLKMLEDLYKSKNGLVPYTFYTRYGLMPSEILSFVQEYQEKGIVEVSHDNRILLTEKGYQMAEKEIYSINSDISYSEFTNHYREHIKSWDSMEINEPYIPTLATYNRLKDWKGARETSN